MIGGVSDWRVPTAGGDGRKVSASGRYAVLLCKLWLSLEVTQKSERMLDCSVQINMAIAAAIACLNRWPRLCC
jgi:hypothetical protein